MPICLSHQSALHYWLTKTEDECIPDCSEKRSIALMSASMREIKEAGLPLDFSNDDPLHVLVPSHEEQRNLRSVVTHLWRAKLPKGSLYQLSGMNLVCSPELAFVQMASCRSLVQCVEVGCHLTGKFAISDRGRGYAGKRAALTTPEEMEAYLRQLFRVRGLVRAREALQYIVPNTASPMEVLLVMAFVLPPCLGGWDMPQVVANQRIDIDEELRPLVNERYFEGDLYLPTVRGNVEYDSYEFHTGKYRYDHTQTRRNILEAMDVKTVSATWGQLETFEKFMTFMNMVKRRFGIERRNFTEEEREEQEKLYERLTDRNSRLF